MALRIWAGVLALLCAVAMPAKADPHKIQMTITAVTATSSPYYIARDKGYFAEQGIAVEFVNAGGGVAVPALIAGSVDFSMSAAVSVGASMRGAALRVIYTMADRVPYVLYATDPAITSLKDMKGKQVGIISRGDTFEIAMRIALMDQGLPQDFVGFTALGAGTTPRQAALASGSLPGVMLSAGDAMPLKNTPAFSRLHVLIDFEKSIRLPYTGVVTSEHLIETQPALVKGFLTAMLKGVRYMRAHKDETVAILKKADPSNTEEAYAADWDDLIPTLTPDGTAPNALIEKDLKVRAAIMNIAEDKIPPIDNIYDYKPLKEVTAALDASGWKPTP